MKNPQLPSWFAASRRIVTLLAAGICFGFGSMLATHAVTLTITNNADAGTGSLRQALADAGADDTINFSPALNGSTILLTSGELTVSRSVTILGPGANQLAINGNGTSRVFYFAPGQTNLIAGLTITNGNDNSGKGGGIYSDRAMLTVSNVILSGNSAGSVFGSGNGGRGGGIYVIGDAADTTLILQDCIISKNSARGAEISFGSGLGGKGGGVFSDHAILIVSNVTLNANSAGAGSGSAGGGGGSGGGIYIVGDGTRTTLTIQHCILSGNSAESLGSKPSRGGGICSELALLTVSNVTCTNNSAVYGGGIYLVGDSASITLLSIILCFPGFFGSLRFHGMERATLAAKSGISCTVYDSAG